MIGLILFHIFVTYSSFVLDNLTVFLKITVYSTV